MVSQESMIPTRSPIDIVVPVYNAANDLRRCVESVLEHTAGDYRVVLIDDASPDDAVRSYFDELKDLQLPHIELLANATNLGFTLTSNRSSRNASGSSAAWTEGSLSSSQRWSSSARSGRPLLPGSTRVLPKFWVSLRPSRSGWKQNSRRSSESSRIVRAPAGGCSCHGFA
jgi:hypothetical protein